MDDRTNEGWLADLRTAGTAAQAQSDLWRVLRRGLGRAVGGRAGVDDAMLDDFAQEACVKVLRRLDSFRGESRFTTWAVAVAVRVAFSELRRAQWRGVSLDRFTLDGRIDFEPPDRSEGPELTARREEVLAVFRRVIEDELTERQRAAVTAELNGMPQEEIARQMGTNRNALYKLTYDARRKLRDALNAAGLTEDEVRSAFGLAS